MVRGLLRTFFLGICLITLNKGYAMELQSNNFIANGTIPSKYTCDGDNISPELHWSEVPSETKSFVLIVDDPDAPSGTWDHWILYNIPAHVHELQENLKTYFFKLYALDTTLNLMDGSSKKEIETAMMGHILSESLLVGRYDRN